MASIISHSPEQTLHHGRALGETLFAGAVIALIGDLGAGKTHFVRGIAAGLGADPESVSSPTFTLIHEYLGGRLPLYHFDLYRLETEDDLLRIGFDDYLAQPAVLALEWADKLPALLPAQTRFFRFRPLSETEREISEEPLR